MLFKRKTLICALLNLIILFYHNLSSQSPIPILRNGDLETVFIKKNGKTAFVLPKGEKPIFPNSTPNSYITSISLGEQSLDVFQNGIAVIRRPDNSFYWIDQKGKTLFDFGKQYNFMGAFTNGYCLAYEKLESDNSGFYLSYLNEKGQNAFGKNMYWEASPFSEGLAVVQPKKNGEWGYIDESGTMVLKPMNIESKHIIKELGSFCNGLAKIEIYTSQKKDQLYTLFINKKGEPVLDINKLLPLKKVKSVQDFNEGLIAVSVEGAERYYPDMIFLDREGKEKFILKSVQNIGKFVNGYNFYVQASEVKDNSFKATYFTFDTTGKQEELVLEKDRELVHIISYDGLLKLQVEKDSFFYNNALYQIAPIKEIILTKKVILGHNADLVLIQESLGLDNHELRKKNGTLIWETPINTKVFTDIKSAMPHQKKVTNYNVKKSTDFENGLFKLTNLEKLDISWLDIQTLPVEISKFKKLKSLTLRYLSNLSSIPIELGNLEHLEYLSIDKCEKLKDKKNLQHIIENAPSLKRVVLNNIDLDKNFRERMKTLRPELKIDVWYSFSD